MSLIIKILSGSHRGAELLLEDGTYVLGGSDLCDIILADSDIVSNHCTLDVKGDTLSITVLEGAVSNGTREFAKGEVVLISPGTFVRFGMTVAYVFREGDSLEDLSIPNIWSREEASVEENKETSIENEKEGEKEIKSELPKDKNISFPGKWTLLVGTAGLTVAIIFLAIFFLSYKGRGEKEKAFPPVVQPGVEEIQAFISSQGYPFVRVTSKSAGLFRVEGVIASDEKRMQLKEILANKPYPIQSQVVTVKEVEDLVKSMLAPSVIGESSVDVSEDGKILISCILEDSKEAEKVRQRIQSEISFMDFLSLEWKIRTIEEMERYLEQILKENYFEGLKITREKDYLLISGSISESRKDQYRKLIKEFENRYGAGFLKEEAKIEVMTPPPPPALNIETVAIGSNSFIITSSGRKIRVGEEVENGYTVEGIEENKVVLRYSDGTKKVIPVQPTAVIKYSW
ncbi:MAG: type III secretion system inner membrane ring subunit SctD [Thermodesulforhabdaceae bacterium]